jgi:hypothetical protein
MFYVGHLLLGSLNQGSKNGLNIQFTRHMYGISMKKLKGRVNLESQSESRRK